MVGRSKYNIYTYPVKPAERIHYQENHFYTKKKNSLFSLPFYTAVLFIFLFTGFFFFTHSIFISSQIYRLENQLDDLIRENKELANKVAAENNFEKIKSKIIKYGFIIPKKVEFIKIYQP